MELFQYDIKETIAGRECTHLTMIINQILSSNKYNTIGQHSQPRIKIEIKIFLQYIPIISL